MKLSITTTHRETLLGYSYLLISLFVLPFGFDILQTLFMQSLSDTVLNLIYFGLNFLCVTVIFWRFLKASVKAALDTPWRCLGSAALGLGFYYAAMHLFTQLIQWLYPAFANVNDTAISQLTQAHFPLMAIATVLLVPVTEETLYRGLLFQVLQRQNRLLAYLVSACVFAAIHVMGYVGLHAFPVLLLCFIQYLPAGIALAWSYEKADSLIAPVLMHIIINLIGVAALR